MMYSINSNNSFNTINLNKEQQEEQPQEQPQEEQPQEEPTRIT